MVSRLDFTAVNPQKARNLTLITAHPIQMLRTHKFAQQHPTLNMRQLHPCSCAKATPTITPPPTLAFRHHGMIQGIGACGLAWHVCTHGQTSCKVYVHELTTMLVMLLVICNTTLGL